MKFPIHTGPQLVSQSLLVLCSKLAFHPAPCASFDLPRSSFPCRGGGGAGIFSKFSDEAYRPKADLYFDMPPNDSTIFLRLHSQQIHFANTVLYPTDCEE